MTAGLLETATPETVLRSVPDPSGLGPEGPTPFAHLGATVVELLRYASVAIVALGVDVSTLYICTSSLHLHYLVSAALGFVTGLLTNYLLCVRVVFSHRRFANAALEFQLFAAIGVMGLLINEVLMWVLTERLGVYYVASKLASAVIVFGWNFAARKFALFK